MKYEILIILALLVLVPAAMAGEAYSLNSFEEEPSQGIVLAEKDAVRFNLVDGRHQLYLKEIGRNGFIKVKVFPYIDLNEGSESWYAPLQTGRLLKADLDQDGVDDLMIKVDSVDEEKKTATLLLISIEHQYGKKEGFNEVEVEVKSDPVNRGLKWEEYRPYIVIGAVVIALLAVIFTRKFGKKPPKEEPEKEEKPKKKSSKKKK